MKVVKSELTSKTANIWMKGFPRQRISRSKNKAIGKYGEKFSVATSSLKEC